MWDEGVRDRIGDGGIFFSEISQFSGEAVLKFPSTEVLGEC